MFSTIIDKDPGLSNIEKLQHLRSCLKDAALDTIKSLEISDSNYPLGDQEQIANCFIVQALVQKLDPPTQAKWEESCSVDKIPSWEEFSKFLERRCQTLENVELAMATTSSSHSSGRQNRSNKALLAASPSRCRFCSDSGHSIYTCTRFGNLSPALRLKEVKKMSLCINCLKDGHQLRSCNSSGCRKCGSKHHTLLHLGDAPFPTSSVMPLPAQPALAPANMAQGSSNQYSLACTLPSDSASSSFEGPQVCNFVLLATANVFIKSRAGSLIPCRAILDSGSQVHIVTSRFVHLLQLKRIKSAVAVSGLGDSSFKTTGYAVQLSLSSNSTNYSASIEAVVASSIVNDQPDFNFDSSPWNIPSNLPLADPEFNKSKRIDLLIGANNMPEPEDRIDDLLQRFWEVESCPLESSKFTKEETECEDHFQNTFVRLPTGEYEVQLPKTGKIDGLGESYQQAFCRFLSLERKLERRPDVKEQYSNFIKEYLELNHMSLVPPEDRMHCRFFLPHHCVFKDDSTTTKLRVVFDGSAASSGISLNDTLMAGPTIQAKLFNILIRFRTFAVALTGDIGKMYRCVRIAKSDSYLQCILWRDSDQDDISIYKLDTVTYGTKPAAFLSVRAMHQLAMDEQSTYPVGSQIVRRDFYVDDLITGGSSIEEVEEILHQTKDLLSKGHFMLRKWCSNIPVVLENVPEEEKESFLKFHDGSDITKTLGLAWDPASDVLLFSYLPTQATTKPNKRSVLSTISRFYDPLGLISPVITKAKIFLQELWKE
ncbi:uncharacterized protein LOC122320482 [Drosophila ficusphila]|uniref:uncharacterized protein LOC122320482 n=1 Tax=Drosophila ficusphila TaxID=30025 RepID=UPI001C8A9A14|nr:uncharacterized protein LOC122320482 [Drosophila ficusphila]